MARIRPLFFCMMQLLVSSLAALPACYPPGEIACKVYNFTQLDCAFRSLLCVPPLPCTASLEVVQLNDNQIVHIPNETFDGLYNLVDLNLSQNNITCLYENSFKGLYRLRKLDLSFNRIRNITGTPFRELVSLKTLDLTENLITALSKEAFAALSNLEVLKIYFYDLHKVPETPFANFKFLQSLIVYMPYSNCTGYTEFFTGLGNLKHLDLTAFEKSCFSFNFCSLHSLQILYLAGYVADESMTYECFIDVPLESLSLWQSNVSAVYRYSHHLINISIFYEADVDSNLAIQDLCSLDSSLTYLSISVFNVSLNSDTFECLANSSATLTVLEIVAEEFWIEGSPFKWFPCLHLLKIQTLYMIDLQPVKKFSKMTFDGLQKLQELHLNYLYFNIFETSALHVFSKYNTLQVLNVSKNDVHGYLTSDELCSISSSLEILDFSYFKVITLSYSNPCMPQLHTLRLTAEQLRFGGQYLPVAELCNNIPNLRILDVTKRYLHVSSCECPNLQNLYLYGVGIYQDVKEVEIHAPNLHTLYMGNVFFSRNVQTLLRVFKSQNLQILSLRSNKIVTIDEEFTLLVRNLTQLDLSDNLLTEIGNLDHLINLQTLNLRGNQLTSIPVQLLSKYFLSRLVTLDLRNNQLTSLRHPVYLTNTMKALFVGRNQIRYISGAFLFQCSGSQLDILDFSNNPLVCNCTVKATRNWLLTDRKLRLFKDSANGRYYHCNAPDVLEGLAVTEIHLDCQSKLWMYIFIGVMCFLIIITTGVLAVRYQWHIRYIHFLMFHRRLNEDHHLINNGDHIGNDDDEGGLPRYDAYVIYHIQDEDWVDEQLLANIEEGEEPFRLCLKTRDIRAGRPIFNELSLHMQRSRKVVAVLSPHFAEDNWCNFELNMSHHRVLEENPNVLIFILLEELPQRRKTLLLRQLFCRLQCLKWPADGHDQYLFWRRLREELKRPVPLDRHFQRHDV